MLLGVSGEGLDWKTVAELSGAGIALITLAKGTVEYIKQGTQKRTELFLEMEKQFYGFLDICGLLEKNDSTGIGNLSYRRKVEFIGFYENLALMMQSGLLKRSVIHYMFGYYALRCWESDAYWGGQEGLSRASQYWALFAKFAKEMEREEANFLKRNFQPKRYRM